MYGDCISYNYTSQGQKLVETVWNGSKTSRREYIGPMELLDGRHVRTNMPQGYFDSLGVFHAYIPDIQGNIVGVYEAKQGVTQLEQLNEYYAYGALTADSRGQDANRRKYTAKELTTDLGLNTYDFSARRQYPAVGRFDSPDSKTHEYRWLSPYAFCAGDPINFADPTGNDIYRFDEKSGDMILVKKTDDDFDQIGDFKYDKKNDVHILKTDRNGNPKTLIDKVEKGILSDGLNMKVRDNVWKVGDDGTPSVEGFQEFALDLSEIIGLEIGGYYYAPYGSDNVSHLRMGKYLRNTNRESHASANPYGFPELRDNVYIHTNWHTHPTNASDRARFEPSKIDNYNKNNTLKNFFIKNFIILTKGHAPIPY
ncbi:MAG: hypothetical protein K2O88_00075 [Paramuribaculum sp.]|nr:hypothetical protein [Paramuribaculum sp.]